MEGVSWKHALILGALEEDVIDSFEVISALPVLAEDREECIDNVDLRMEQVFNLSLKISRFLLENMGGSVARVTKFGREPPLEGEGVSDFSDQVRKLKIQRLVFAVNWVLTDG